MLEFDYVDFDPHFNGKLTFDLGESFLQVSLLDGCAGQWSYFDLDVAQLKALKEFVGGYREIRKGRAMKVGVYFALSYRTGQSDMGIDLEDLRAMQNKLI